LTALRIQHRTIYRFRELVSLAPHRLLLRPRESRELRFVSHELKVSPAATTTLAHDVFGNAVAVATFTSMASTLIIESIGDILLTTTVWPVFDIAASAISYPFRYSDDEWIDLGSLTIAQYSDAGGRLQTWARSFVRSNPTDTLSLLKDLNAGVAQHVRYQCREVEGTQSPNETLERGLGSCRDFAVLFTEAARKLGFGARLVSGYLHDPGHELVVRPKRAPLTLGQKPYWRGLDHL
jgi:transglutaminase-like putative cysteine protease